MTNNMINLTCQDTITKQELYSKLVAYIRTECEKIDSLEECYYDVNHKDNDGIVINYRFIDEGLLVECLNTCDECIMSEVVNFSDYQMTDLTNYATSYWAVVSRLKTKAMESNIIEE